MNSHVLVVGGAGYIGSHMVDDLKNHGFNPIVLDNLSTGYEDSLFSSKFIKGDMADSQLLDKIFSENNITAIMHFASYIQVGESVQNPAKYYKNNVANTLSLLNSMLKWKIKYFIFSSSAAVYGEPKYTPIDENHPLSPINPYGQSKKMIEDILIDFSKTYDFKFSSLRYFNASGAHPQGHLRERHIPETHLIPLVLEVARGNREFIEIYGDDYPTQDGTCIRDYIHVIDLCSAHLLALKGLLNGNSSSLYNLGTGLGFSVKKVIEIAQHITDRKIKTQISPRRKGDPAILIANAQKLMSDLNWKPLYPDLETIILHAWNSLKCPSSLSER